MPPHIFWFPRIGGPTGNNQGALTEFEMSFTLHSTTDYDGMDPSSPGMIAPIMYAVAMCYFLP